jgi:hypothetical protein
MGKNIHRINLGGIGKIEKKRQKKALEGEGRETMDNNACYCCMTSG